jgi:hypothetical protein
MAQSTAVEATELSAADAQKRAEQAFAIDERIKASLKAGREAIWELSQALHEFDETSGWLALGYEHVSEWLADPEIGMKQVTYNRCVRRWRQLSQRLDQAKLIELEPSKVDVVMPVIEGRNVPLKDVLADVRTLGWRDLREKYVKPKPPEVEVPVGPNSVADANGDTIEGSAVDLSEPVPVSEVGPTTDDGSEAVSVDGNGYSEDVINDAREDWEALRTALVDAMESGAANPRVPGDLIRMGVRAVDILTSRGEVHAGGA